MPAHTSFLKSLGLKRPIMQAPMAGVTDANFVVAACEAGILGSLGAGMLAPEAIEHTVKTIRENTNRPFNVNLFVLDDMPPRVIEGPAWNALIERYRELDLEPPAPPASYAPSFREQLAVTYELAPPVVSFTFGLLDATEVSRFKRRGCLVVGTATHPDEVDAWTQAGADAICLQGAEAGGHRGTFLGHAESTLLGLLPLLQLARARTKLPLFAAGGIMHGAGIAAAQCLGAEAAQLGTALLFCNEAPISATYRHRLEAAEGQPTQLTRAFSGRLARGIENHFMTAMQHAETLPYPLQNALTQPLRRWATEHEKHEYLSLWAGQGVRSGRRMPLQVLVQRLEEERQTAFANMAPNGVPRTSILYDMVADARQSV